MIQLKTILIQKLKLVPQAQIHKFKPNNCPQMMNNYKIHNRNKNLF